MASRKLFSFALLFLLSLLHLHAQEKPSLTSVVEGLYHPLGMALLPDGSVLVSEMGSMEVDTRLGFDSDSAGISIVSPDGIVRRLVSGFPSGRDPSDMLGALALAVSPDQETIYIGHHNAQRLYTLPVSAALNPRQEPYRPQELESVMTGARNTFLLHPFDIGFTGEGAPLLTDSLANSIVFETEEGARRSWHRFAALDAPRPPGGKLEAVPRGIARFGEEIVAALFAGCPHPPNSGELVAIDQAGVQRTLVNNLNMPIDVAIDAEGDLWLLEFAAARSEEACFSAADLEARSGRLSRLNRDSELETIVDNLDFPGAVLPLPDGSLYISEVYAGRVLRLRLDGAWQPVKRYSGAQARYSGAQVGEGSYVNIADADRALRQVIEREALSPYPGSDKIEGDTALARLGRELFFDPILSGDKNISCATCHHPSLAMADGRPLSIGTGGHGLGEERVFLPEVTVSADTRYDLTGVIANPFVGEFIPRNSPTVINAGIARSQFWDSRVEKRGGEGLIHAPDDVVADLNLSDTAIAQAMLPIISRAEMAGATFGNEPSSVIRENLAERLRGIPAYAAQFETVFGSGEISPLQIAQALAAFERQLIFTAAPWDDYIAGDKEALTDDQKRGALLFYGDLNPQLNCVQCHSGNMFTDIEHYNLLVPQIGPGKRNGPSERDDFGRSNVTFDHRDQYKFRTPSLRNVELTAPYFHSGAYPTLADVIRHHGDIWRGSMTYDPSKHLPDSMQDSYFPYNFERQAHSVSTQLADGMPMSEEDVADLVAFLMSLTDPAARELSHLVPESAPSGLPLDPVLRSPPELE
ncbi:MAG: ScyD/ScyE family protein [Chloroflexota bacterium]|nr:ScyD/ScyE family protein [Chloroflexota bacterium]